MNIKNIADSAAHHGLSELERVAYLDGWRGLAIAFVLLHHFWGIESAYFGRLGVDIFFCLSGLLMSRILFIKKVPLTIFYKRRISRIMPSFLLYVGCIYSFAYFTGNALSWTSFAATVSFLRSYLPVYPDLLNTGYPLAHIWSLNVEEHCYILLSLITLLLLTKKRVGMVLIGLGSLAISIHLSYNFSNDSLLNGRWINTEAAMACLMISAGYTLFAGRVTPWVKPWMPILTLVLNILLYLKLTNWLWIAQVILSPFLLAFTVNHLAQTPVFFRNALASTPLRLLGISSYSVYLWQQPFYEYCQKVYYHQLGFNLLFLLMALVLGNILFYCFENPLRTYLNKIG